MLNVQLDTTNDKKNWWLTFKITETKINKALRENGPIQTTLPMCMSDTSVCICALIFCIIVSSVRCEKLHIILYWRDRFERSLTVAVMGAALIVALARSHYYWCGWQIVFPCDRTELTLCAYSLTPVDLAPKRPGKNLTPSHGSK